MTDGGLQVRSACQDDLPLLVDIEARAHQRTRREDRLARWLSGDIGSPCRILVAGAGSEIRGFLAYQQVLDCATLLDVSVDPAHQGCGVGAALLDASLAEMRDRDVRRCELEVRASNYRAVGLYRSRHFVRDGLRSGYYSAGNGREDAILMSLEF